MPVTREQIIDAYEFAVQHDPQYAGTYADLMEMLADRDDDEALKPHPL